MGVKDAAITITYYAYDTNANAYKTGDNANHTLRVQSDGTLATPAASPAEVDATNMPGAYDVVIAAGENDGRMMTLGGKSTTSDVIIIPVSWMNEVDAEDVNAIAAGAITASAIATDAIDADAIATDALGALELAAGAASEIATSVWANATRTLTQSAASVAATVSGTTVTVEPYATWTIALTGLGDFSGYTNLWFGVKTDPDQTDAEALLLVDTDTGALHVNGAAAGAASDATITVDDASNGDITLVVKGTVTGLDPQTARYAVKWTQGTTWAVLTEGQFRISSTIVRDVGTGA